MSADHAADVQKEVRVYIAVFAAVAILTLANVALSYMTTRVEPSVAIALMIAAVNAVLVIRFFMHFASEGRVIHVVWMVTALFFLVMLFLIMFARADQQGAPEHHPVPTQAMEHHVP